MSLVISGTITNIQPNTKVISDKFSVRHFAIETEGEYPQPIKFQTVNKKCDLLDSLNVGQFVDVFFNLRGNKTQDGKIFNNLDAWKIENKVKDAPPPPQQHSLDGVDEDLPF